MQPRGRGAGEARRPGRAGARGDPAPGRLGVRRSGRSAPGPRDHAGRGPLPHAQCSRVAAGRERPGMASARDPAAPTHRRLRTGARSAAEEPWCCRPRARLLLQVGGSGSGSGSAGAPRAPDWLAAAAEAVAPRRAPPPPARQVNARHFRPRAPRCQPGPRGVAMATGARRGSPEGSLRAGGLGLGC